MVYFYSLIFYCISFDITFILVSSPISRSNTNYEGYPICKGHFSCRSSEHRAPSEHGKLSEQEDILELPTPSPFHHHKPQTNLQPLKSKGASWFASSHSVFEPTFFEPKHLVSSVGSCFGDECNLSMNNKISSL